MTTETTALAIPDVYQDDEGWNYWAAGHHEPALFLLGVIASNVRDCGLEEGFEQLVGDDCIDLRTELGEHLQQIEHCWFRADPAGSDEMHRCMADDDGAEPFTRLSVG